MNDVNGILFDAGGTLVRGELPWYELYRRALILSGSSLELGEMMQAHDRAVARMVADRRTPPSTEAENSGTLHDYLADELDMPRQRLEMALDEVLFDHPEGRHLVLAHGAADVLAMLLDRGYTLGVISNWSADLPTTLRRLGLSYYLSGIFASETMGRAKPHPAAFLVPLDKLGLTPGRSAYVGDLYHIDVLGSRDVGMRPVLIDPLEMNLHDDVPTIATLFDLLDLFPGV